VAANYCDITRGEMASLLEPKGFRVIEVPKCHELVWELPFKDMPRLSWRIFSSISPASGTSRGCGQDAIRVVVWDKQVGKPITGANRTNRVPGWRDRLKAKVRSVGTSLKLVKCPDCGAFMIERKGKFGKFLGCSRFPRCKTTKRAS